MCSVWQRTVPSPPCVASTQAVVHCATLYSNTLPCMCAHFTGVGACMSGSLTTRTVDERLIDKTTTSSNVETYVAEPQDVNSHSLLGICTRQKRGIPGEPLALGDIFVSICGILPPPCADVTLSLRCARKTGSPRLRTASRLALRGGKYCGASARAILATNPRKSYTPAQSSSYEVKPFLIPSDVPNRVTVISAMIRLSLYRPQSR
ncbi:hypothetical protein RRG08_011680 [Elysia crispata]|uniref:Uncharacterized protein n=1 Tax=Elysia crispata TaxID=231223 RepID=A0AAE1DKU2_9GAST|nr:hypothetical protein RRG08_011680 [Elysia crispata]